MFKNKPRKNRFGAPSASRLRLENLEERQLLTAVGLLDAPYGSEPAPVVCTAAPEVDNSPAVDLSDVVLTTTGETTTWTVMTNADSGVGSLRSAISSASEDDTIKFDLPVDQRVISLNSTLTISKSLTIDASNIPNEDGTPGVTIDAQNKNCVISISSLSKVSKVVLNGLKITGGKTSSNGGGICIGERSRLETIDTTISNNTATGSGGGVYGYGRFTNTTISNNMVTGDGGAIDVGQYCNALLGGELTFTDNKATSTNLNEGFGGAIFSVETLTFEADGTYTFTGNTATKSGGAIDACAGTLNLAGEKFTFGSNVANEVYGDDKTGFGGAIATAAVTTVANGTTFEWKADNKAARGNCVAIDLGISPGLTYASFGLEPGDDYSTFTVIRPNAVKTSSVMVPATFASNAVVATITTSGVSTTFGSEGVTPEQLGLGAGTHEALIQYTNADGETSAVYSLVLTVDSTASLDVCETSIANGRGVKFDFNLTNADGRAVSVWDIAWGDGTTTRLEKLSTSWLAAHYYAQDGTFDVSLTIEYLDGTGETFEAFSTQKIGAAPVATTSKTDALACVFAESEDLFDEFGELDDFIGPMPLR